MLAQLGDAAAAEAAWRAAHATAAAQEARLFGLRAAQALAALLARDGRVPEARALLAPALLPFAQVEEPVVRRARVLLDALLQPDSRAGGTEAAPSPV
jgi:hypothetical protein